MLSNLSESQKKFIKYFVKYKKDVISIEVFEVLSNFFKDNYEKLNIEFTISRNEIKFYSNNEELDTEKIKLFKDDLFSIIVLLEFLVKEKLIITYEPQTKVILGEDTASFLVTIKFQVDQNLFKAFLSNYSVSPLLKDFLKNNFRTSETKNQSRNFIIAIVSIIISVIVQIYVAKNINTVVEFANPINTKLQLISEVIIIDKVPLKLNYFIEDLE